MPNFGTCLGRWRGTRHPEHRNTKDFLDRLKDMIVTGGETVYCGEVDAVILAHPAIREVALFGIPDPQWGELVAAVQARC